MIGKALMSAVFFVGAGLGAWLMHLDVSKTFIRRTEGRRLVKQLDTNAARVKGVLLDFNKRAGALEAVEADRRLRQLEGDMTKVKRRLNKLEEK